MNFCFDDNFMWLLNICVGANANLIITSAYVDRANFITRIFGTCEADA